MNIYFTLDYELFHGTNAGSVEKSLIEPTNHIESILNKYDVKGIFFVDTTYLCKLKELKEQDVKLEEEYKKITDQIKGLSERGHSIQLHIHPQWYYSQHKDGKWIANTKYFKISSCPQEDIDKIFSNGIELIKSITGKNCTAYRAGGYSIQSMPDYSNLLMKHGIKIDSSCLCGKKKKSEYQTYNFSSIKRSDIYTFDSDILIKNKLNKGNIIELPITTKPISNILYAYKKLKYIKTMTKFGNGSVIADVVPMYKRLINKLKLIFTPLLLPASIDSLMGCVLMKIYRYAQKKQYKDFTIICHPKSITNHSLVFLDKFLEEATKTNQFKTIDDII